MVIKLLTIATMLVLVGCQSTPEPFVTKTQIVNTKTPVFAKVPESILTMPVIPRPWLSIYNDDFFLDKNYWNASVRISESIFELQVYAEQLEQQNQIYRSFVESLPTTELPNAVK